MAGNVIGETASLQNSNSFATSAALAGVCALLSAILVIVIISLLLLPSFKGSLFVSDVHIIKRRKKLLIDIRRPKRREKLTQSSQYICSAL